MFFFQHITRRMIKKLLFSIRQKLWKISLLLIVLIIIYHFSSNYFSTSTFYRSRLRPQKLSSYRFRKFRNLSVLINTCEQMMTIDCLTYLHENRSDYLQALSSVEENSFQKEYCIDEKRMLFHTFWSNPRRLDDPLLLLHIQSHLYTQNRQCSYLIIWTLPGFFEKIEWKYKVHEPYLQFRTLMPLAEELRQVGVDIHSLWSRLFGKPLFAGTAIVSDAVRFVVLHKYGGMYVDADILLLRDLQPFYTHEFAYRWSNRNEFNTAVLRLSSQSNFSSKLLDLAHQQQDPFIFYPTDMRSRLHPMVLNRMPCVFFDPLWLVADGVDLKTTELWSLTDNAGKMFETVFHANNELSRIGRSVFNGAFAFHWHTLHQAGNFEPKSYLYEWNEFLKKELLEEI